MFKNNTNKNTPSTLKSGTREPWKIPNWDIGLVICDQPSPLPSPQLLPILYQGLTVISTLKLQWKTTPCQCCHISALKSWKVDEIRK